MDEKPHTKEVTLLAAVLVLIGGVGGVFVLFKLFFWVAEYLATHAK